MVFLTLNLIEKGCNVTLFEQAKQLGGRIHTVYEDEGISYEAGAGRFNVNHKLLIKLLRKLGLTDRIKPILNTKRYFLDEGHKRKHNFNYLVNDILFNKVVKAKQKYSTNALKSMTLKQLMQVEIGDKLTSDVIGAFGYNSEFEIQNAYTSIKIFEKEFNENIQYYYLQGGLSQITTQIHRRLMHANCTIHTNTTVYDYNVKDNTIRFKKDNVGKVKAMQFSKVVFCVTRNALQNFTRLLSYDTQLLQYINGIRSAPLNRIFARFPRNDTKKVWFEGLPRVTTNLPVRYIIPLNESKGIIQISYTDNNFAKGWHLMKKEELEVQIVKILQQLFPTKVIPAPLWIKQYYWNEGATYWEPSSKPFKNKQSNNYVICGEMNSAYKSGWMEGALQSVQSQLGKIKC